MQARSLVKFRDVRLPDNINFGIIFDNDWVLCFCCGSWFKPDEYEIVEDYNGFEYLEETLEEYF